MKICSININGEAHLGVVTGRGIVDATAAGYPHGIDEVIAGADRAALEQIERDASLPTVDAPEYLNVVTRPGKLVCVGLNYRAHAENVDLKTADVPILFSKFADSLAPSGAEITLPEWEESYDYEAELVIVIGRRAWNVTRDEATEHIFGYTCGNDLSCRAPQQRTSQWLIGKAMPGFGPCGPCIATADSVDPERGMRIRSFVNGELRQDGSTADMIHTCADIVSYASRHIALEPGDLIFTGTPSGVALEKHGADQRWLKPGDTVEIEIDGIGRMVNKMV